MTTFTNQTEFYKLVCSFDLSIDIIRMTIGSEGRHFYRYTSEGNHRHIWCNKLNKTLEITSTAAFSSIISTMEKICLSAINNIETFEKRYSFIRAQDAKFIDDYNSGIISSKKNIFMISLDSDKNLIISKESTNWNPTNLLESNKLESNKLDSEDQISILTMDSAIMSSTDCDTYDTPKSEKSEKTLPTWIGVKYDYGLINNKLDPNKTFADVLK